MSYRDGEYAWTTRDGERIPVRQMTDDHLENAIRWLEKQGARRVSPQLPPYPSFNGDMAQFYGEREWEAMAERAMLRHDLLRHWYEILKDERMQRGIRADEAKRRK